MAAIAKFLSYDGGIAFSDSVLKIQKRDEERGRLIPLDSITAIEVDEPLIGEDGCIRVHIAGERLSARSTLYFDDDQYGDALDFKSAFDSFVGHTAPELPPLEMFQPTAIARGSQNRRTKYAELERPRRPARQPRRKRRFRWWYVLIALLVIGVISQFGKDSEDESQTQESASFSTMEPTISPEPTAGTEQTSMDALCSILELAISDNFEHYNISYEDTSITVSLWQEGIAAEVTAIQMAGGDENNSDWVYLKNSITSLAGSMCNLIDTAGRTDVYLYTSVQNDQNTDNTLLMLLDQTIIYDCLAGGGETADLGYQSNSQTLDYFAPESTPFVGYTSPPAAASPPEVATQQPQAGTTYVLNTSTMKFHSPLCRDVGKISAGNRQDYTGTRDEVIAKGYSPCGHCHP